MMDKADLHTNIVKFMTAVMWLVISAVLLTIALIVVCDVANAAESSAQYKMVKDSLVLSTYDNGFWYYWGDNGQFVALQTGQDTVECLCGSNKYWIDRAGIEIDPDSARAEFTHSPPSIIVECWTIRYERRK